MLRVQARVLDATHLELSEPIRARQGERIVVALPESEGDEGDRAAWLRVSAGTLRAAYGESEPQYGTDSIRERNPEYHQREKAMWS